MDQAYTGLRFVHDDGRPDTVVDGAQLRSEYVSEYRVYVARRAAGHVEEQSEEAEAGGILESESARDIRELLEIGRAWLKANSRG